MQAARPESRQTAPLRVVETASPESRERWIAAVHEVLRRIESGDVRKVVLSRDIVLEAGQPIDPWELLRLVHARDPHGMRFCLRFDADSAFLGASPERLVSQRGSSIACDCLAGTIARGTTPEAQARNAAALLASEMDGREHRIVLDEILAAVARTCAPSILRHSHASSRWRRCCISGAPSGRSCARVHTIRVRSAQRGWGYTLRQKPPIHHRATRSN